jgi:hypothetical protein
MEISMVERPDYPIVSSGIDWVTTFNAEEFNVIMCAEYMDGMKEELKSRGHYVQKSVRMGYIGWSCDGAFHGFNEKRTLAILSSDLAREFGVGLLQVSQQASRLDLQVTIDASAERPVLSLSTYHYARNGGAGRGRPRELKLTQTHPNGDTLNVNKRTSDTYGRLYDYGAAHKSEEKHRLWRYEVETKRDSCRALARRFNSDQLAAPLAESYVAGWFAERTFHPPFTPRRISCPQDFSPDKIRPGVLAWFEDSVSVTVARAIKDFGAQRTLEALKLETWFDLKPERREGDG